MKNTQQRRYAEGFERECAVETVRLLFRSISEIEGKMNDEEIRQFGGWTIRELEEKLSRLFLPRVDINADSKVLYSVALRPHMYVIEGYRKPCGDDMLEELRAKRPIGINGAFKVICGHYEQDPTRDF